MVKIEVTLDRFLLDRAGEALQEVGIPGLTVSEVRVEAGDGRGRQIYRGSMHGVFRTMLRLDVVVSEEQVETALEAIRGAVSEEASREARMIVIPVAEAVRIRTGDRGGAAVRN